MVRILGLVLMVASNVVAWRSVSTSSSYPSLSILRSAVWKIALFYTLWALYNKYLGGRSKELGHISFGLLMLSCLGTAHLVGNNRSASFTKIPLLASCGLVVLNFAVVIPLIVLAGGPKGIAKKIWDGDTSKLAVLWGYTFTAYIVSNVVLWSYCCYLFHTLPLDGGYEHEYNSVADGTAITYPTIEEGDYNPVESADL